MTRRPPPQYARSAERCGYDYDANDDAVVNALDLRGCSAFVSIRDEESFYGECIPYIETLTCAQLDDPSLTLPASCSMQLLR